MLLVEVRLLIVFIVCLMQCRSAVLLVGVRLPIVFIVFLRLCRPAMLLVGVRLPIVFIVYLRQRRSAVLLVGGRVVQIVISMKAMNCVYFQDSSYRRIRRKSKAILISSTLQFAHMAEL